MKKSLLFSALALTTLFSIGQTKKWQALEGVFQSPANKDMYVRFTPTDSLLVAHLLWNNGEVHLLPDTGLAFVSREIEDGNPIRVSFQQDASGEVNRASVANNGIWTRVKDYKPPVKEEMAHTPGQLEKYTGIYKLMPDSSEITEVIIENNSLTLHGLINNGHQPNFVPSAEGKFFRKDYPAFTLDFSEDPQGSVTQFVAVGRLRYIRIDRTPPSPAQVKSYEGKYRSVDDPDNMVQLMAEGTDLVVRQLWNKKDIRLQPVTTSYFNDEKLSYPVQVISENGQVKRIILLGNQIFTKINP
jgi:hypothetical protein